MIVNDLVPTNDYNYRLRFIEQNIETLITYFNPGEKRVIDGGLDLG